MSETECLRRTGDHGVSDTGDESVEDNLVEEFTCVHRRSVPR